MEQGVVRMVERQAGWRWWIMEYYVKCRLPRNRASPAVSSRQLETELPHGDPTQRRRQPQTVEEVLEDILPATQKGTF